MAFPLIFFMLNSRVDRILHVVQYDKGAYLTSTFLLPIT